MGKFFIAGDVVINNDAVKCVTRRTNSISFEFVDNTLVTVEYDTEDQCKEQFMRYIQEFNDIQVDLDGRLV